VDAVRVGVGNGAVCETRIRTGVGTPQATAVFDCISTLEKYKFDVPVIADGGVRFPSDVAKALALGAKTVMIGSLFSGTKETPGILHKEGMWPNERLYKRYSGEASFDKKLRGGEKTNNVEGNSKRVPYKGKLKRIVNDIMEGVRSSMSYVGAESLSEYCEEDCTRFVEVTVSGMREAMPHLL
jgi:IMP dehydrogenase